ncbi:MAG: xanthine dehydrogenase family protein subunit M [Candidatus Tectomicrobia bacterium]
MLQPFRLEEPTSVGEASALLAQHGESARIYAGGTELLLVMKEGLLHYERLVNIKQIPGIAGVSLKDGTLCIGAATPHRTLERSPEVRTHFPTIADMESHVANVRVREVGTLGGNLCFAEPHADPGTLLQVYDASVQIERQGGSRSLTLEAFFVESFEVALEEDELLTEIRVPPLPNHTAAAYLKFGFLERPSVGVAVAVTATSAGVQTVRLAVGCVGPTPRRVREAEALLSHKELDEVRASLEAAGELAGQAADAITDLHGSAEYKEYLVGVLLRRAFEQAYQQTSARE